MAHRLAPLALALIVGCIHRQPQIPPSPVMREFRAAWVASVGNIDWPSRPGLSSDEQLKEMIGILDRAVELKLNAIILQVRPACDALYVSKLEPWSEYLTGRQGRPPEPFYDPLARWVAEAHQRGLELHAWFNPYRARVAHAADAATADNHISRIRPDLVRTYGDFQWLDPGDPASQEHTVRVFLDVVKRYDIDGVHIDDYFYPYRVAGQEFPDEETYAKYGRGMSKADWRRNNINRLIERIYREIKREKPAVKFGISPFGIWRPGHPEMVRGMDQYEAIYADAKLWLNEGWCDYFTPQIYWKISATQQPYGELLKWWISENTKARHIWPGNYTSRIQDGRANSNWPAEEILAQIELTRNTPGASGNVHFSMKCLMQNRDGIAEKLRNGAYAMPALSPRSPWLEKADADRPEQPRWRIQSRADGQVVLRFRPQEDAFRWVVYLRYGALWEHQVAPAAEGKVCVPAHPLFGLPEQVAVTAVDRAGNESRGRVRDVRK